jgi:hypothetical protein
MYIQLVVLNGGRESCFLHKLIYRDKKCQEKLSEHLYVESSFKDFILRNTMLKTYFNFITQLRNCVFLEYYTRFASPSMENSGQELACPGHKKINTSDQH